MIFFYKPGGWWAAGGSLRSSRQAGACPIHKADVVGAPCKLLCIRYLTEIRVMVFTTLKIPKPLLLSGLQVALLLLIVQYR